MVPGNGRRGYGRGRRNGGGWGQKVGQGDFRPPVRISKFFTTLAKALKRGWAFEFMVFLFSVVRGPAASASPGSVLGMLTLVPPQTC